MRSILTNGPACSVLFAVLTLAAWAAWPSAGVPYPLLLGASVVPAAWSVVASVRENAEALRRIDRGLCRGCGYDVRGSRGCCPECGRSLKPHEGVRIVAGPEASSADEPGRGDR